MILIGLVILLFGLVAISSGRGQNSDFRGLVIVYGGRCPCGVGRSANPGQEFRVRRTPIVIIGITPQRLHGFEIRIPGLNVIVKEPFHHFVGVVTLDSTQSS
jgi:hypothetical protein